MSKESRRSYFSMFAPCDIRTMLSTEETLESYPFSEQMNKQISMFSSKIFFRKIQKLTREISILNVLKTKTLSSVSPLTNVINQPTVFVVQSPNRV